MEEIIDLLRSNTYHFVVIYLTKEHCKELYEQYRDDIDYYTGDSFDGDWEYKTVSLTMKAIEREYGKYLLQKMEPEYYMYKLDVIYLPAIGTFRLVVDATLPDDEWCIEDDTMTMKKSRFSYSMLLYLNHLHKGYSRFETIDGFWFKRITLPKGALKT